jgi:ubiquinone/menaquinone biosynthesis C-methylase UbiE
VYEHYATSARQQRRWAADNPGNAAIRAELVSAVFGLAGAQLRSAREIVDIGCGTGWWLEQLARRADVAATLHGVEILPERLEAARARVPEADLSVADARDLPLPDGGFDVVTLFTVLSSLASAADAEMALREAWRVVAPGGVLLVWEPRLPNPLSPNTLLVSRRMLEGPLDGARLEVCSTTVLPALARALGRTTGVAYPLLNRIRALRTHRLVAAFSPPPRR